MLYNVLQCFALHCLLDLYRSQSHEMSTLWPTPWSTSSMQWCQELPYLTNPKSQSFTTQATTSNLDTIASKTTHNGDTNNVHFKQLRPNTKKLQNEIKSPDVHKIVVTALASFPVCLCCFDLNLVTPEINNHLLLMGFG